MSMSNDKPNIKIEDVILFGGLILAIVSGLGVCVVTFLFSPFLGFSLLLIGGAVLSGVGFGMKDRF